VGPIARWVEAGNLRRTRNICNRSNRKRISISKESGNDLKIPHIHSGTGRDSGLLLGRGSDARRIVLSPAAVRAREACRKGIGKFYGQCRGSGSIQPASQHDSNFAEWTDHFGLCSLPEFVQFRRHFWRAWIGV
jgi:hypothetical protein